MLASRFAAAAALKGKYANYRVDIFFVFSSFAFWIKKEMEEETLMTWESALELGAYIRAPRSGNLGTASASSSVTSVRSEGWVDCTAPPKVLRRMIERDIEAKLGLLGRYALCELDALLVDTSVDALVPLSRWDVLCLAMHSIILSHNDDGVRIVCCGSVGAEDGFNSDALWPRILPKGWRNGMKYQVEGVKNDPFEFELTFETNMSGMCVAIINKLQETNIDVSHYFPEAKESDSADTVERLKSLSVAAGKTFSEIVKRKMLSTLMRISAPTSTASSQSMDTSESSESVCPSSAHYGNKKEEKPGRSPKQKKKKRNQRAPPRGMPQLGQQIPRHPLPFPQSIGGPGGFADDLLPGGGFGTGGNLLLGPGRNSAPRRPPGVPPGARFDPYGPGVRLPRPGLGPGNFGGAPPSTALGDPDSDHLPPPGYNDMFV